MYGIHKHIKRYPFDANGFYYRFAKLCKYKLFKEKDIICVYNVYIMCIYVYVTQKKTISSFL